MNKMGIVEKIKEKAKKVVDVVKKGVAKKGKEAKKSVVDKRSIKERQLEQLFVLESKHPGDITEKDQKNIDASLFQLVAKLPAYSTLNGCAKTVGAT